MMILDGISEAAVRKMLSRYDLKEILRKPPAFITVYDSEFRLLKYQKREDTKMEAKYYETTRLLQGKEPSDLNWSIMEAVRDLAKRAQYFDPEIYACVVGRLIHGHACEMSPGDFMIIDTSKEDSIGGHEDRIAPFKVVPNHVHVIIKVVTGGLYKVAFCEGTNISLANPGPVYAYGENDPCYRPYHK